MFIHIHLPYHIFTNIYAIVINQLHIIATHFILYNFYLLFFLLQKIQIISLIFFNSSWLLRLQFILYTISKDCILNTITSENPKVMTSRHTCVGLYNSQVSQEQSISVALWNEVGLFPDAWNSAHSWINPQHYVAVYVSIEFPIALVNRFNGSTRSSGVFVLLLFDGNISFIIN